MVNSVRTQEHGYSITTLYLVVIYLAIVPKDFVCGSQSTVQLSLKTIVFFILHI